MPVVNIPQMGRVKFPDGLSDAELEEQVRVAVGQHAIDSGAIKLSPYEQADAESMAAGRGKAESGMESGTELTTKLANDLASGSAAVNRFLLETVPGQLEETGATLLNAPETIRYHLAKLAGVETEYRPPVQPGQPIVPPPAGPTPITHPNQSAFLQGMVDSLAAQLSHMTTPGNVATLGAMGGASRLSSAGAQLADRIIAGYFGGTMVQQLPEAAQQSVAVFRNPNSTPQERGAALAAVGGPAAMATMILSHASGVKPAELVDMMQPKGRVAGRELAREINAREFVDNTDAAAVDLLDPRQSASGTVEAMPRAVAPEGVVKGEAFPKFEEAQAGVQPDVPLTEKAPEAAAPVELEPNTKRRFVNAEHIQSVAIAKANQDILVTGKWPNGKEVHLADRKRLKAQLAKAQETKAKYDAMQEPLMKESGPDLRLMREPVKPGDWQGPHTYRIERKSGDEWKVEQTFTDEAAAEKAWSELDGAATKAAEPKPEPKAKRKKPEAPKAAEQPQPQPESAPQADASAVEKWLKVEEPDAAQAKESARAAERQIANLREELKPLEARREELEKSIISTRGPRWARGKIKTSAPKAAVKEYHALGNKTAEIHRLIHAIEEGSRKDRLAADDAFDAAVVNDSKQSVFRRLAKRRQLYVSKGLDAPKELLDFLHAEADKVTRENYPDATPEELARVRGKVISEALIGEKPDYARAFSLDPELNLANQRLAKLESRLTNEGMMPVDSMPPELRAQINRFSTKHRSNQAEYSKPVEKLGAKDLETLLAETERATVQWREQLAAEQEAARLRAIEEEATKRKMMQDAQAVASSAPHVGTKGAPSAKYVKEELLRRLQKAHDEAPFSYRENRAPGEVVIAVPGDGVYTLTNTKANLADVIQRAGKIDTRSNVKFNVSKGGSKKGWTEDDWLSPDILTHLENVLKSSKDAETRAWAETALRQARQLQGLTDAAEAKAPKSSSGSVGSPAALQRGGELGDAPPKVPPQDDPRHSVFDAVPMEMPEAVRAIKFLTGLYPRVRERLSNPRYAGVFSFTQGPQGKGRVSMRADTFDLLTEAEKAELRKQAREYAEAAVEAGDNVDRIARERYEHLLDEAYKAARTRNPIWALKVMWHEIGHVVDWLPDKIIRGRGNLFGRLASLKNFTKHVLPLDPSQPSGKKLTAADKAKLHEEAIKQLRAELGPIKETVRKIIVEEPEFQIIGITPEDVTNILREGAGKATPELTRWFAEQDSKVKAEILRKAMRGMLDERLKALGKTVQTGTRKVEKTVREKVGREPTPEEIRQRFAELLQKEIKARNLADLATVKAELEQTIAWWRGTEKMEDYFRTSEEMYAEAFSVFANNPAALETRAPTYAKLMWNYMERKPEVRALYDQIQADIKSGRIMPERVKSLHESWDADDARSLEAHRESRKARAEDFYDNVVYHIDRRFGPIYRHAKGSPREGQVREAIGTFLYRATEHERFLAELNSRVGKWLVQHNLDWSHDLGEYLFHKRVVNERFNLANPLGWTSKNSLERLAEMQQQLGPERWNALEIAAKDFHGMQQHYVVQPLVQSGMFTPELVEKLQTNLDYATFAAVKDLPDRGIERLLALRFGEGVTPHIYRQIGNLGEIKNPATATVLKGLSLISAAYRNNMKREVVRLMMEQDPGNIMPAEMRWTGKAREPVMVDSATVGTVVFMQEGKPRAFYVRKVVADAVNQGNPTENVILNALVNLSGWQKGLFTQLNYAFWPVNFVRDTAGATMQLPGALAGFQYLKHVPTAIRAARDSVTHARPNPHADAALARKMVISKADPRGVWAAADNEYELKLASFGVDPAQWSREADKVHALVKAWNFYRELGQTAERVNKIAGMLYLDEKFPNMPEWKKREIVRERSGSPNFLERGASNPAIDLLWLFYNPWKEGVRSMAKSARENPFSFTAKATGLILMPTILQAAAVNGWLGDDLKKRFESVPDYYLSNYLLPWVEWADKDQGKVAALKLPLWEPARIAHGLVFRALTGRGSGLLSQAGGQLPSLNPLWQVGLMWSEYTLGKNPHDYSRGVNVLSDAQQEARGPKGEFFDAAALAEMGKQTWNELGGGIIHRFKNLNLESPPESGVEELISQPFVNNALGRWLIVTDRGNIDAARRASADVSEHQAELRLAVQQIAEKVLEGEALTKSERMVMREPYAMDYLERLLARAAKSRSSPVFRALEVAPGKAGRAAVLEGMAE